MEASCRETRLWEWPWRPGESGRTARFAEVAEGAAPGAGVGFVSPLRGFRLSWGGSQGCRPGLGLCRPSGAGLATLRGVDGMGIFRRRALKRGRLVKEGKAGQARREEPHPLQKRQRVRHPAAHDTWHLVAESFCPAVRGCHSGGIEEHRLFEAQGKQECLCH